MTRSQTNMQQDSSLLHWFPPIKDILPTPRTRIVHITPDEASSLIGLLDGEMISENLYCRLKAAAQEIGYPVFLRSDQGSAKHDYLRTCRLEFEERLLGQLACLIEWHLMWDLWPRAIVFRELLQLNAPFRAFEGLPIAKERRYFVDEGKVLCHHPYWPEGAIEQRHAVPKLPDGWQKMLAEINQEDEDEIACLTRMAESFAEAVPGFYSVDFAQKKDGQWILIDAARGELSWHPEHDEHEGAQ